LISLGGFVPGDIDGCDDDGKVEQDTRPLWVVDHEQAQKVEEN